MGTAAWRICVDTGGTFTDALARTPWGEVRRAKVLSTGVLRGVVRAAREREVTVEGHWGGADGVLVGMTVRAERGGAARVLASGGGVLGLDGSLACAAGESVELSTGEPAPVLAARLLTGTPRSERLPAMDLRLATTRGTNALLTRRGARVAFFVTRGFGDLLEIGWQHRPDLFALDIVKPGVLHERSVAVDERVGARGEVLRGLDEGALRRTADEVRRAGIVCAAVAFLHADRFPDHERRAAAVLRQAGFEHVVCSHEAGGMVKVLPRAQTAVVDAYLGPVVRGYVEEVRRGVGDDLLMLTSAGGLVGAGEFRARESLLSGPAGGVVGARDAARRAGMARAVSFDMGGTSTDVARLDEHDPLVYEHRVADAQLTTPAVAVHTVAAGGGSVCGFDGTRLCVGPASAGADPGPACYGRGGPLTITDVNLLLGLVDAGRFPIPIDEERARAALEQARENIGAATGVTPRAEELLDGFRRIAAERIAGAVRAVSARKGYDPRGYALVAFGGAGGQHACDVADLLGMGTVLVPMDAGLLSAQGLHAAAIERMTEEQVLAPLAEVEGGLAARVGAMVARASEEARRAARALGIAEEPRVRRVAAMRLLGQEATLEVGFEDVGTLAGVFESRYCAVFGHEPEKRGIELVWVRAIATVAAALEPAEVGGGGGHSMAGDVFVRAYIDGAWRDVRRVERGALAVGDAVPGPALIFEDHGAVVVPSHWSASADASGGLVLTRRGEGVGAALDDEVALEVFTSRCESIAAEMGEALQRTAVSTNVKERLDFSCAILDAAGELIVNAPHVPVHLGSLGLCVRTVREHIAMGVGDVVVTNHPGLGGSHLPDVTIITPIHDDGGVLVGYAASRAHHAEIGGTRPGSMPPGATRLEEEGVIIAPMHAVRKGGACWGAVERVLRGGAHPSRNVADNLADMRAAAAANQRGAEGVRAIARELGAARVGAFFERIKARAHRAALGALAALPRGEHAAEERLDDGSVIRVRVTLDDAGASIDFGGTSGVHPGNLNATPAIVRSAVVYVVRLLVRGPIPLNEGLMRAVRLEIPPGMLNPGFDDPPAVAGGNVETSQRVVDTLLKALGVAACSQGTMNNVVFGSARGGYYETVCGGAGATPTSRGASAVHTHMTNTRITDPEILETRYPVRLERFEVRRGSGGVGRHRGGDGVVREMTFLAPVSLSVITQHRTAGAYGLAGGAPGSPGRQRVRRADGTVEELAPTAQTEMGAGDALILETPGGGGWGIA
jgi:5-oxoprolinase (ATP-hydrolysing)